MTHAERRTVLRHPGYLLYLGSRLVSGLAQSLLRAAIPWHVFELTGSYFQLGLIGLVQFLPALGFSLIGGAVADHYDRRRIAMLAQTVSLSCGAALCAATAWGRIDLGILYALIFLVAVATSFENPARMAMLPLLVPREVFPRAVTLNAVVTTVALTSGPVAMGFTAARFGIAAAYAVHAGLMAGSLALLSGVHFLSPQSASGGIRWTAIREGLQFVWNTQVVLGCMTLDMFAVVFGGALALLPVYAREILRVDELGYGLLAASFEAGSIAMALVLVALPTVRRAGRALLFAVAAFGLATIAFGLSTWFPLSLAAYALAGMADQLSVVMRGTTIQLVTPDALRGRVSSVNMIFIGASNQLGMVESGFVAALTSPVFSVVSGGVGCLVVLALVAWRMPELRRYRVDPQAPASAQQQTPPPVPGPPRRNRS